MADPRDFWLPFNSDNERWIELKDHRPWWFGDAEKYPPRMDLLNVSKLLVRGLPLPRLQAKHIEADFELDGRLDDAAWPSAESARIESQINIGAAEPEIATTARVLWSDQFLYICYHAPAVAPTPPPSSATSLSAHE